MINDMTIDQEKTKQETIQTFKQMMIDEINTIPVDDIKEFGLKLLEDVPEYFFIVPASSSGKYHSKIDLGDGGLVRHSIAVKRMLGHILEVNPANLTDRQKNLLKLGALFHDCMKSGTQEDYKKNPHTKFLHPVFASLLIIDKSIKYEFPCDDAIFVANAVASHMGKWNSQGNKVLPLPETPAQRLLHLADYLGSRKDVNMEI